MDKVISTIPSPFTKFLQQSDIENIEQFEKKGSAYFSSNREIFKTSSDSEIVSFVKDQPKNYQSNRKLFQKYDKKDRQVSKCIYCQLDA